MKKLALLFSAMAILASCGPEPFISVSQESFEAGYQGGVFEVVVTSNYVWTATSVNPDMITIEPSVGSSGDTVSITVLPNEDGIEKELKVMFSCTSSKTYDKVYVTITQDFASPEISASASAYDVPYSESDVEIIITSNLVWTASYDRTKLSLSSTTGTAGKDTVTATIFENQTGEELSHQIDFACSNAALSDTCSVYLCQAIAPEPYISVSPETKAIAAAGGDFTASVTSRYKWTAEASQGIVLSAGSGDSDAEITVTVPENTSSEVKNYFVRFLSSINEKVVGDTLNISQEGKQI